MKKILLVLDAAHIDTEIIHFACNFASLSHSTLTGLFYGNYEEEQPEVKMEFGAPYIEEPPVYSMGPNITLQQLEEHMTQFKSTCAVRGVRCDVHFDNTSYGSESIITESRFADFLIIKASATRERKLKDTPTPFVKDVLAAAECPVLVAPASLSEIKEIVFAYDGSRSAVFAIKQFTYLFPELSDKKAVVLQVNKDEDMPVTEQEHMGKWLRLHYSSIGFQVLQGKASEELFAYLYDRQHAIVVMGSYGRNGLSELIKPATASPLLKTINLPFFITHC
ncbi:hypothetical protein A4D02_25700 [Niastella koreensis]|uniref:UspA domain-containing protein n=2 Tax=Niastella koreensis TaxID=354356 RepID=G8TNF4_NIAKG|nr:universal stress protein [Niastella koreensis]AEV99871.1 hypothetical protein Niako_3571 [Niastella koreensis GR20-10]OQP51515.1 hypothetical protein A4D02_25700 [Niastella koreensis]